MIKFYVRSIYKKSSPNGFIRRIFWQLYLVILAIFNNLLHIFPFGLWKRALCKIVGIKLGTNTTLCSGVRFMALGNCQIGDGTIVNRDCLLDNRESLKIGSNVSIATCVKIFTQGHDIECDDFSITRGEVVIDDHVSIFASALIMPGVRLGKGCVVYPGSVVTNSVSDMHVVGGNPARYIKMRVKQPSYKLRCDYWYN